MKIGVKKLSDIRLDEAIAKIVYKQKIAGYETCVKPPDNGWGVYPGTKPGTWSCFAERRPVVRKADKECKCVWERQWGKKYEKENPGKKYPHKPKRERFKGHLGGCYDVVLPYSTWRDCALELAQDMDSSFGLYWNRHKMTWEATFSTDKAEAIVTVKGAHNDEEAMSTAIARAALAFVLNGGKRRQVTR